MDPNKKHILAVDDDPVMLKLMNEHLHGLYEVASAINGKVALKFLETHTPDLILLDYEMPGLSGPELLAIIRKDSSKENIPVIFMTGASDNDRIAALLSMKPQGYLTKPVDKELLLDKVKELIG